MSRKQYSLYVEGLSADYDWRKFKDLIRQRAQHGIRGDVYDQQLPGQRGKSKLGIAKVICHDEAVSLYTWLTSGSADGRHHVVHLFDASQVPASLMDSNCTARDCKCGAGNRRQEQTAKSSKSSSVIGARTDLETVNALANELQNVHLGKPQVRTISYASSRLPINTKMGFVRTEPRAVFVRGLDYRVGEKELLSLFSKAGSIQRCVLHTDHHGKSKGTASIEYATSAQAKQASETFTNWKWHGRIMQVRLDKETVVVDSSASSATASAPSNATSTPYRVAEDLGPVIVNGSGPAVRHV